MTTVLFLHGQKKKKYDSAMFGNSAQGQLSVHLTTVLGNAGEMLHKVRTYLNNGISCF